MYNFSIEEHFSLPQLFNVYMCTNFVSFVYDCYSLVASYESHSVSIVPRLQAIPICMNRAEEES